MTQPPDHKKLIASTSTAYGRGDRLHEEAADAGSGDGGNATGRLELRVALDEFFVGHELGQVTLVRDVEEDRQHAGEQRDDEQLADSQAMHQRGYRHAAEHQRPPDVAGDQDRSAPDPVAPCTGRQPDQQEGRRLARGEHADLERGGVQRLHRHEGQRQHADLRANLADRVADPKAPEVSVVEQAAFARRRGLRRVLACGFGHAFELGMTDWELSIS